MVDLKADYKWAVLTSIIPGVLIGFLAWAILYVWPLVLIIEAVTGMASVGISLSRSRKSGRSDSLATGAVSGLLASLIGVAILLLYMPSILAHLDKPGLLTFMILIFPISGIIAGALGGLAYYYLRRH